MYRGNLSGVYNHETGEYDPPPTPFQRFRFAWETEGLTFRLSVLLLPVLVLA